MKKLMYIFTLVILNSCANLASLQDGRTLKKNEIEIAPFAAIAKFSESVPDSQNETVEENFYFPILALRIKYGIVEKFDAGVLMDLSTNFGITTKYQFLGNKESKINSSVGIDFGTNLFGLSYNRLKYYYSVPLYLSYYPNQSFCLFTTPRLINDSEYVFSKEYSKENVGTKYNINKLAVSYGFLFGKRKKIGIEISHNSSNNFIPTQLTLGYNLKF